MVIELRDYQVNGVKKALSVKNSLICMQVGKGKTAVSLFALRKLIKDGQIEKGVVFCTKTSTIPFIKDLKNMAGVTVKVTEKVDDFFEKLNGPDKIIIAKHAMIEKLGLDYDNQLAFKRYCENHNLMCIIDEAHKIQNPTSGGHSGFDNIRDYFSRIVLLTATPYSSCISQIYGLVSLIYPKLWRSKTAFMSQYTDELVIRDRHHRVLRKDIKAFKNLADLRSKLEPFTYFYFPPIKLNYYTYTTRLKDYTEYDNLCMGLLEDEEK